MKVSETLMGAVDDFLEVLPDMTSHLEKTNNPHSVTKEQVGLENVINERQMTEDDLSDHADGTIYRHSAESIDYSESFNLKEKIDDLIITGGGGTMYHDELLNCDSQNAHPMSAITGLEDTLSDIDGKIDEVIIFEGTTTDDTPTELTSSQTSDYINAQGRLTLPVGRAAAIEVTAVSAPASGGEIVSKAGCCFITFDGALARINSVLFKKYGDVTVENMDDDSPATSVELVSAGVTAVHTKVTGLADTTLSWRVEVRIKTVLDVSEQ